MNDVEKRREEIREMWSNPSIIVKWENAYSILAKHDITSNEKQPFFRFKKYKDENGVYIILYNKTKVYEVNWKRI